MPCCNLLEMFQIVGKMAEQIALETDAILPVQGNDESNGLMLLIPQLPLICG